MSYRVKNWREYEQSLRARGDITLWISQDAIDAWRAPMTGKRGAQPVYADIAIETALALRLLFHLPLRQTEGFFGLGVEADGSVLAVPGSYHAVASQRDGDDPAAGGACAPGTGVGDRRQHRIKDMRPG